MPWQKSAFAVGVLTIVALAATVIALALQTYFGRSAMLAGVGQAVAVLGAGLFAWWFVRRSNGRR